MLGLTQGVIIWHQPKQYIPGSSRYVNVLPFGRFFVGEKAEILHTWKIQVVIREIPQKSFSQKKL